MNEKLLGSGCLIILTKRELHRFSITLPQHCHSHSGQLKKRIKSDAAKPEISYLLFSFVIIFIHLLFIFLPCQNLVSQHMRPILYMSGKQ